MNATDQVLLAARPDFAAIARWVAPGARVLDLGCGDGALLRYLWEARQAPGYGVEIDDAEVLACFRNDVNVLQLDLESGLALFQNGSFDYVILSETLQTIHRIEFLTREMLRVGKEAIVSFPNFGHWQARLQVLAGRMPGLQDGPDAPPVGVVNEAAVREIFDGAPPVGRTLRAGGREVQVVGVINDMPYRDRRSPVPPTLYESAFQRSAWGGYHVFLRTDVPVARLEVRLREAVARVDPDIPVPHMRAQTEIIAQAGAKERVLTQLLTLFGGFALLLASIGLHGVTSYAVTRRTSEIGVRVAVGARPGQILWMVLRQVVVLAGIGLVVGVPAAVAGAPLVGSLLYGVAPTSPTAILAATAVMLGVAVVAGLLPALRAAKLDALVALRSE